MSVFSVLIAGVGGQGVLLTSKVLAEAALASGLDVKQSEVHGMAQRGGSVVSHVRFGEEVFSPVISPGECDLVIGFEPLEAARYIHFLRDDGAVVYSTRRIMPLPVSSCIENYPVGVEEKIVSYAKRIKALDAASIAIQAGDKRALNIVMLGAAIEFVGLEERKVAGALKKTSPPKALEINKRAYLLGKEFQPEKVGRPFKKGSPR